ncbi:hypothetical protein [Marinoscillum sp.]|uniref:hypothetical protein n=1 Tax=Marinoscillum sp. TaxID=2024838 RepID=UPI003BAA924B
MGVQDLFITPIYIILFSLVAYFIRPYVTTRETRRYFMPALWARFGGAIMLGVIYQFYYGGGDTFNYFTHGSRWIWEAFTDSPVMGFKLLLEPGGERVGDTFEWSQHIWYYRDPHSFTIVRIAGFFDLFTMHTYSATALFFASFSFSGLWAFYSVVEKKYGNAKYLAYAILFVPTVVFWGSGILKDTITLGALAWLTWAVFNVLEFKKYSPKYLLVILITIYIIYSIKIYIIACYIPMAFAWAYLIHMQKVRNILVKMAVAPILLFVFAIMGYYTLNELTEDSSKYSIDAIAEQAAITAYDIRYGWGARTGGDGGYDLGELDGTWQSMIRLMPAAINVSLFRPYLWEVRNPLMLLAALESSLLFILTLFGVFKKRINFLLNDPFLVFCLVFALMFAFAVGVSTFNFGTLMRYKIPLISFYAVVLVLGIFGHKDRFSS